MSTKTAKVDAYGSKAGTRRAKMNAVVVKAGKDGITTAELTASAKVPGYHASAHLAFLVDRGYATKHKDGRVVMKAAKKPATKKAKKSAPAEAVQSA